MSKKSKKPRPTDEEIEEYYKRFKAEMLARVKRESKVIAQMMD